MAAAQAAGLGSVAPPPWHPDLVGALPDDLHQLVDGLDYPVFVVTAAAGEARAGCLVGFVTQASIDPTRLLVFVSRANHTFEVAMAADHLAVHVLTEDNLPVARWFGQLTGDEVDKFSGVQWEPGPGGTPVLADCRGWVVGRVLQRTDGGDHVGHLLDPVAAAVTGPPGPPLMFTAVRDLRPGHPA